MFGSFNPVMLFKIHTKVSITRTGIAQVVTIITATPSKILFKPFSIASIFSEAAVPTVSTASLTLSFKFAADDRGVNLFYVYAEDFFDGKFYLGLIRALRYDKTVLLIFDARITFFGKKGLDYYIVCSHYSP